MLSAVKSEGTDAGPSHASAPLQQSAAAYPTSYAAMPTTSGEPNKHSHTDIIIAA